MNPSEPTNEDLAKWCLDQANTAEVEAAKAKLTNAPRSWVLDYEAGASMMKLIASRLRIPSDSVMLPSGEGDGWTIIDYEPIDFEKDGMRIEKKGDLYRWWDTKAKPVIRFYAETLEEAKQAALAARAKEGA